MKCISRIWKEAGGRDHVVATMFRKSIVTAVRRKHPMSREVLAQYMSHRVSTADNVRGGDLALPVSRLKHQAIQEPAASSVAPTVSLSYLSFNDFGLKNNLVLRTILCLCFVFQVAQGQDCSHTTVPFDGHQTDPQEGERELTPPREDPETPPLQRPDETER
ncbi:hypothetical protein FSP39_006261 [Pinctada imbricata]|uniref:Uncharacterized protein n=1 Tax=Pinctada imbricata TaxID=66713 RepID=A0AA88YGW1_PINIB|nr:hypothetical protein FSP39_006261 [Pinctada imbricata]